MEKAISTIAAFTRIVRTAASIGLFLLYPISVLAERGGREPHGFASPISSSLCEEMRLHKVLNPRAPVGCQRLKLVKFDYIDFDQKLHADGQLVVLDAVAYQVVSIFEMLLARKFPIASARLMNQYDGDDENSMADNNTSAFNVREIAGGGPVSVHAYGLAIDVNPVQNPYVKRSGGAFIVSPKSGEEFLDRNSVRPGMAEPIVDIFADHGFNVWGGDWRNPTDYQHFQVSRSLVTQLVRASPQHAEAIFNRYVQQYQTCRTAASRNIIKSCAATNGSSE